MTLYKGDIIRSVKERVRFQKRKKNQQRFLFPEMDCLFLSQRRAKEIVNTMLDIIEETLAKGEDQLIRGFGKFQVKFRWARKGTNPQTGESIILRSRRAVTFKASRKLREKINTPDYNDNAAR